MPDSGNLKAVLAKELETWFDGANEIARDWIDFENEARNLLHIIHQHQAEHTPADKTANRSESISDSGDARGSGSLPEGVPEREIEKLKEKLYPSEPDTYGAGWNDGIKCAISIASKYPVDHFAAPGKQIKDKEIASCKTLQMHVLRSGGLEDAEPKEQAKEQGVKVPPAAPEYLCEGCGE